MQGGKQLAELTNHTTSGGSAPRVSFSLSGRACLACGFSSLFIPRSTLPVLGGDCSATRRFGRSRQSGALRSLFLHISRSHLLSPGEGFRGGPLWANQWKQEGFERLKKGLKARKKMHIGFRNCYLVKQRKRMEDKRWLGQSWRCLIC